LRYGFLDSVCVRLEREALNSKPENARREFSLVVGYRLCSVRAQVGERLLFLGSFLERILDEDFGLPGRVPEQAAFVGSGFGACSWISCDVEEVDLACAEGVFGSESKPRSGKFEGPKVKF